MSVSAIEGTLEAVTVKRRASKVWRLGDIKIRRADGGETALGMAVATPEVAAALQPGVRGRFYLYKAIDHQGIHGVRPEGGALVAQFPRTNETLMAVLFVINLVVVAAMLALDDRLPLLALLLLPFTGTLFFVYRKTRLEAEAQLAADGAQ